MGSSLTTWSMKLVINYHSHQNETALSQIFTGKSTQRYLKYLKTQNDQKLRYENMKYLFHCDKHFFSNVLLQSPNLVFFMRFFIEIYFKFCSTGRDSQPASSECNVHPVCNLIFPLNSLSSYSVPA